MRKGFMTVKMKQMAFLAVLLMALCMAASALAWKPCQVPHVYEDWKTLREPTCTREGYQRMNCINCNHWEWRNIPKLPHTQGEWTIENEPTCTKRGSKTTNCTVCGTLIRHFIDMVPHEYGEATVTVEPTCTKSGKSEQVCTGCGKVSRKTLDKLGHDYVVDEVTKEPTCTAKGKANATCSRCGSSKTVTLDMLPHEYGEWTILREPKGEKMGRRENVCAVCGKTVREDFFPDGTLYQGMDKCPEVTALQEKLVELGYYDGGTSAGLFGPSTAYGVRRFQKDYGLEQSGVAYPETLEKLEEVWSEKQQ